MKRIAGILLATLLLGGCWTSSTVRVSDFKIKYAKPDGWTYGDIQTHRMLKEDMSPSFLCQPGAHMLYERVQVFYSPNQDAEFIGAGRALLGTIPNPLYGDMANIMYGSLWVQMSARDNWGVGAVANDEDLKKMLTQRLDEVDRPEYVDKAWIQNRGDRKVYWAELIYEPNEEYTIKCLLGMTSVAEGFVYYRYCNVDTMYDKDKLTVLAMPDSLAVAGVNFMPYMIGFVSVVVGLVAIALGIGFVRNRQPAQPAGTTIVKISSQSSSVPPVPGQQNNSQGNPPPAV